MTAFIYFVCLLGAAVLQAIMRMMLQSGAVSVIPGTFVFYLVAIWIARKWSNSYKERKERESEESSGDKDSFSNNTSE